VLSESDTRRGGASSSTRRNSLVDNWRLGVWGWNRRFTTHGVLTFKRDFVAGAGCRLGASRRGKIQAEQKPASQLSSMFEAGGGGGKPRKEIYTYQGPWTAYAMGWRRRYEDGIRGKESCRPRNACQSDVGAKRVRRFVVASRGEAIELDEGSRQAFVTCLEPASRFCSQRDTTIEDGWSTPSTFPRTHSLRPARVAMLVDPPTTPKLGPVPVSVSLTPDVNVHDSFMSY
jgi:hypothetical protein